MQRQTLMDEDSQVRTPHWRACLQTLHAPQWTKSREPTVQEKAGGFFPECGKPGDHHRLCGGWFLLTESRFIQSSLLQRVSWLPPLSLTPWGFCHILWLQTVAEALCKFA